MDFGLSEKSLLNIRKILGKYPEVEEAIIYGSRAMGNHREGSDIDLTLIGDGLTYDIMSSILGDFDDSYLPYLFDVSIYSKLKSDSLKDHIDRVGKVLYSRTEELV